MKSDVREVVFSDHQKLVKIIFFRLLRLNGLNNSRGQCFGEDENLSSTQSTKESKFQNRTMSALECESSGPRGLATRA